MEKSQINDLAKKIYDLDSEVYAVTASSMGRTFVGSSDKCIKNIEAMLCDGSKMYLMRSEIALISNMARTIEDKAERNRLMHTYDSILKEIEKNYHELNTVDIMDSNLATLNSSNKKMGFSEDDHIIICISRSHGSAGADIGFKLADKLRMSYYDVDVFNEVFKRIDEEKDEEWQKELSKNNDPKTVAKRNIANHNSKLRQISRYHGLPKSDAFFFTESSLLCDMAKNENFVVIGRCADSILSNNNIPHISIYVTAPFEQRAKRMMDVYKLSYKEACKQLVKIDAKHAKYYKKYTGKVWGSAMNYDLCINSSAYGVDEAVELIQRIIDRYKPVTKK